MTEYQALGVSALFRNVNLRPRLHVLLISSYGELTYLAIAYLTKGSDGAMSPPKEVHHAEMKLWHREGL